MTALFLRPFVVQRRFEIERLREGIVVYVDVMVKRVLESKLCEPQGIKELGHTRLVTLSPQFQAPRLGVSLNVGQLAAASFRVRQTEDRGEF